MIASLLVSMQVTNKTATVTWLRDVANYGIPQEYPMKNYKGERQYINGQNAADRYAYQYGGAKMGAVGCELIATYNALLALGNPMSIADIAWEYRSWGMVLDGHFGTHPSAVPLFFEAMGYSVTTLYNSDVYSYKAFDYLLTDSTVAILSYWNNADSVGDGLHTVTIKRGSEGKILVYNEKTGNPESQDIPSAQKFDSIEDFLSKNLNICRFC